MKAFIFDLINKLQRTSNALDAKAILCNKTWRVFSDTGEKEVYIFMEDGKLVISSNGVVEMGTWMYVPSNQSLVITGKQNYLVHPVICNNILALIVDGTNQCAFLLDDTKKELEAVNTIQNIGTYVLSNLNTQPKISNTSHNTFQTAPNLFFNQNQGDDFAFGQYGVKDGQSYRVDMRQINRLNGQFVRANYICNFISPFYKFTVFAHSSDYDSAIDSSTFEIVFDKGRISLMYYHSLQTNARVNIFVFEKSILGLNKRYEKHVNYHLPNSENVEDEEKEWFNRFGDYLRKDINRYRTELETLLGISDVYDLFERSKYQIW